MVLDPIPDSDTVQAAASCVFCAIVRGEALADIVLDHPAGVAFLDHRPLLPGHALLVPRPHIETLPDLPTDDVGAFFTLTQRLTGAVQQATGADGAFMAINHIVSQSVPHLHVHIVPRRHRDRLFSRNLAWTRHPYRDDTHRSEVAAAIRAALAGVASD